VIVSESTDAWSFSINDASLGDSKHLSVIQEDSE